ncbi:MAG: hypothetical protein WCO78_00235 [Candidatus Roizmanbacteria bacterium]
MLSSFKQADASAQIEQSNLAKGVAQITSSTTPLDQDVNLDDDPFEVPAFLRKK